MKRFAFLIANRTFPSSTLSPLRAPSKDIAEMRNALEMAPGGGFVVTDMLDQDAETVINALGQVLREAGEDNFVLIYYSGHGLPDDKHAELSLATRDTTDDRRAFKELKFGYIVSELNSARNKRALIVLDCCYSALAGLELEAKGVLEFAKNESFVHVKDTEPKGATVAIENWKGIYLLTATLPTQMSYGVKQQTDQGEVWQSQFTEHLVSHLSEARSLKQNVTVHGLYRKLHAALQGSRQTPMLFSKGGQSDPDLVIAPRPLPYEDQQEESKAEGWIPLSDAESSRLKQLVPVYLLDSKFHLKDWNPAFESVIARQLRLTRGQHASEFLQSLENWSQVQKISLRDFKEPDIDEQWESDRTKRIPNTYPPVHVERFDFRSQKFGLIVFDKLATQIRDLDGASKTWCVTLNVTFAQKAEEFWHHLKEMTVNESQWSKYAMCYDEIIGAYPEYQNLVKKVVAHVRPALRCLDIGAGTGNSTKAILDQNPKCHVTAIENNEAMLRRFAEKFQRSKNYRDRIRMLRGDALSQLLRLEREEAGKPVGELFDACVMLNVLFVLDDPVEVLKSVRKLLKFGAVLSISNPRKGTDVSKLFKGIQQHLDATGQLEKKKQLWEAAYLRNKEMMPAANRDSLTDLRRYIESAGFVVEGKDIEDSCYHDCVVVIKAINPGPTALAASS